MISVHDERKFYANFIKTFILMALLWVAPTEVLAQQITGVISRVGDTTHLEFKGRKNWRYENPIKKKNTITLTTPAFDDATIVQLQSWSCPLIKEIKVNKSAPDNQYEITVVLNSEEVESFDYLTDDPSYLIFDFYQQPLKKSETAAAATTTADKPALIKNSKKNKAKNSLAKLPEKIDRSKDEYSKIERKPAGNETLEVVAAPGIATNLDKTEKSDGANIQFERGVFDGGDPNYDRFRIKDYQVRENAIIASQQNIYIRFPILQQKLNQFAELMKNTPEYEVKNDASDESKTASLILVLYKKGRWGALFETLKYFEKKFPKSKYEEIVKNIEAEAHIKLFDRDHVNQDYEDFRSIYSYLIETYPNSPLTERNHLLLAYSSLQHKDGAETLRSMKQYLDKYPNSAERDRARLAMAESYVFLNKPEDAIRIYEEIIKDPLDKNYAVEAAYRIGDVYMGKREYKKALDSYREVQAKYPAFKTVFPNAQYNMSEALFWLGQHRASLDSYISFLQTFPADRHAGFAQTRIGELLEVLGADQRQVMGAFIEGYFRFPESQGSEVARIKMLSRGLKGMPDREKKRAVEEIDEIAKKSTLPEIVEFATLMKADGISHRSEYKESLNLLVKYYQNNPTSANVAVFKGRILRNISDVLREEIANKNYIEALNFYGKYSTTWLKNSERIDIPYFEGVAYEHAGVSSEAKKLYFFTAAGLKSISGKKEETERKVYENLPTLDEVNLRLAVVALEEKKYQDSYKYLNSIKNALTPEQEIERVRTGATVSEQMGDIKRAIEYLEKMVASYSENIDLIVRPEIDLARLYIGEGKLVEADKHLQAVEKNRDSNAAIKDEDWSKTLELRADLQYKNGQKLAAVESYTKLLDAYETKYPLSAIRYKAGKILFEEGDLRGAEKIWASLSGETSEFYKKLATEKISQAQWQDTYKKYIDRIPAAQDLK